MRKKRGKVRKEKGAFDSRGANLECVWLLGVTMVAPFPVAIRRVGKQTHDMITHCLEYDGLRLSSLY